MHKLTRHQKQPLFVFRKGEGQDIVFLIWNIKTAAMDNFKCCAEVGKKGSKVQHNIIMSKNYGTTMPDKYCNFVNVFWATLHNIENMFGASNVPTIYRGLYIYIWTYRKRIVHQDTCTRYFLSTTSGIVTQTHR
jgi:hypothetical protein